MSLLRVERHFSHNKFEHLFIYGKVRCVLFSVNCLLKPFFYIGLLIFLSNLLEVLIIKEIGALAEI